MDTEAIEPVVVELAKKRSDWEHEDVGLFFREKGSIGKEWSFRPPAEGAVRVLDEISSLELGSLVKEIKQRVSNREAGLTSMTKTLGLSKLRAANRERLERVWDNTPE